MESPADFIQKFVKCNIFLLFLFWTFGRRLELQDLVSSMFLSGPMLVSTVNGCGLNEMQLLALWMISTIYLLDWNEKWQQWPIPSVLASVAMFGIVSLVSFA